MSIKDNTALVIRYVQEVLNKGRIDSIDLICAPDLIIHLPQFLEHFAAGKFGEAAVLDPDNIRGDPGVRPAGPEKRPRTITFILFILINASRQTFLELHPSAGEPRHDRSRRNVRDVSYLLV